jgi:3-deoxy-D-manno-octulosonate 8-phosphate phosphatase (KDO 8-P phosphatase)
MNLLSDFKKISTFVFDIDGVLTDGTLLVLGENLLARQMHVKDGFGLQMAIKKGYHLFIISGGDSHEVKSRLEKLGIKNVHLSVGDKEELINSLLEKKKISWDQVLYMGDDMPDIPTLKKSGMSCCPADAVHEVKSIVKYVSPVKGGWGCVRDVIEKVLKVNGHWDFDNEIFSK